jgi:alpha-beta hydrolase superfamily lysophospholipase
VLVGQSFGGSVLAAWHAVDRITTDALVFCAPALRQQRHRHDPDALAALRAGGGPSLSPLPLDDADYTSSRRHLSMMAADPLMVRQVSASTRSVLVDLEDLYADGWPDDRDRPEVFLAMPEHDAIIDLAVARRTLRRLAPATVERVFPADRHYLEFTEARRDYWQWLAAIAIGSESGRTSC